MSEHENLLPYQGSLILDKAYFTECFEQSVPNKSFNQLYSKAIILLVVGMSLVLFSDLNAYAAWFIFSLGILEVVSTYYRKPWWVARQMLSKASKSTVSVEITQDYIRTYSFYADNQMDYQDIKAILATDKGFLIHHSSGRHYLSNRCLSADIQQWLAKKKI